MIHGASPDEFLRLIQPCKIARVVQETIRLDQKIKSPTSRCGVKLTGEINNPTLTTSQLTLNHPAIKPQTLDDSQRCQKNI